MQAKNTLPLALSLVILFSTACGEPMGAVWLPGTPAPNTFVEFSGDIYPGPCSIEWDFGLDGTIDFRKMYTYDDDGTLLFEEWDRHADGTVDSRRSYSYSTDGELLSAEWDRNANGSVDTVSGEEMDEAMNPVDEGARASGTRDYAYDRAGNVRLEEYDPENDGIINARAIYSYDHHGNLLIKEWDDGADGTVEWRGHYVYECWTRIED
jgi:hypothetical protein